MIPKDQLRPFLPAARLPRMNSVPSAAPEAAKEFLHPGQLCVSSTPCTVTVIVGSCVAVCLWDPILRNGGVTHYILAQWDGAGTVVSRYGDIAIEMLVDKMVDWAATATGCKRTYSAGPACSSRCACTNTPSAR